MGSRHNASLAAGTFFVFILFYFIHYTNDYSISTQDVETSMAATAARARDAADATTGLET